MKAKLPLVALWLASAAAAWCAPLTATTAVHTKPDASSPVITFFKAGSEPTVAHAALATSPAGWLAVEVPGPLEGYVLSKDITKSLDVRAGTAVHMTPKPESGVLTTIEPGEKTEISGLHGKWTQIKLTKKLTGYIYLGASTSAASPSYSSSTATIASGTAPLPAAPVAQAAAPAPAPVSASAYGVGAGGQVAPLALHDSSSASLPRLFQGHFVSTRSAFKPRRPYDYAVNDDSGSRYAYLDVSKLLQTEQIDSYVGHEVVVYGAARALPNGKDLVIEVESLQLR